MFLSQLNENRKGNAGPNQRDIFVTYRRDKGSGSAYLPISGVAFEIVKKSSFLIIFLVGDHSGVTLAVVTELFHSSCSTRHADPSHDECDDKKT